jgi:transglutaminase-like putative cysteine protease
LNVAISAWISYQGREDEGTQSPLETLARGWGSCRDMAMLFIEAARWLGFAARIVARDVKQVVPISGTFSGSPGDIVTLQVGVAVRATSPSADPT